MSDQLKRLDMPEQSAAQLRKAVVEYLWAHPTTPGGDHLKEFVSHRAWDTYLKKMSTPGTWGDWIVLWGLINMLSMEVALVSSLGQNGLRIISPDSSKKSQDIGSIRGGSRIFFRKGCTRLLLYFNTNKPHSFFGGQNTSCIRKPQVILGEGAHPPHPPPRSVPEYGSTWSRRRIPLSLFRAGGFYKVFPKCCRFLDRQVWRGKNNWRVLLRVGEEIPERIIRYTCKWKRLRSVLLWWPDCVRPLPVHGNSPWRHEVSRHLYLWISFWHKRIVWQNVLAFYSPAPCFNTVKFLTQK